MRASEGRTVGVNRSLGVLVRSRASDGRVLATGDVITASTEEPNAAQFTS